MRRKSDMWQEVGDFLPDENVQAAQAAAIDVRDRLAVVEEQLKSQFTSIAAYHQIAQQAVDTARAEGRADLEREKATLVSLIERVRAERTSDDDAPSSTTAAATSVAAVAPIEPPINVSALARIALLEDKVDQLSHQIAQCLRMQEDLANSIATVFERQVRNGNYLTVVAGA